MSETIKRARRKLTEELKDFKGGNKETVVSSHVCKTLKEFCKEEDFAKAVVNSKKTLSDCCKEILSKCGNHISDFEVYKRATQFYFPGAKVNFTMSIKVDEFSNLDVSEQALMKITSTKTKQKKDSESVTLKETIQISLFEV